MRSCDILLAMLDNIGNMLTMDPKRSDLLFSVCGVLAIGDNCVVEFSRFCQVPVNLRLRDILMISCRWKSR
jgi:hypothetical protein